MRRKKHVDSSNPDRRRTSAPTMARHTPQQVVVEDTLQPQETVTFGSGATSSSAGLHRPDLIPPEALVRLSAVYGEGCLAYGKHNWRRGLTDPDFLEEREAHLLNHWLAWKLGDRSEDHLAKVVWGIFTLMCSEFYAKEQR